MKETLENIDQGKQKVVGEDEGTGAFVFHQAADRAGVGGIAVPAAPEPGPDVYVQVRVNHVGEAAGKAQAPAVSLVGGGIPDTAPVVFLVLDAGAGPPAGIHVPGPVTYAGAVQLLAGVQGLSALLEMEGVELGYGRGAPVLVEGHRPLDVQGAKVEVVHQIGLDGPLLGPGSGAGKGQHQRRKKASHAIFHICGRCR